MGPSSGTISTQRSITSAATRPTARPKRAHICASVMQRPRECAPQRTRSTPKDSAAAGRSHDRLAADVDRLFDFYQHADPGLGAGVSLLARQQLREDRLTHRPGLVQLDRAEESQET